MFKPRITLRSLRRRFEALKRKYARVIAASILMPVANQIVVLWNIAVAKKQPKPDPVDCVHIVAHAGFRPKSWNSLHGYIDHCERYHTSPGADEIINHLLPPKQRVILSEVLPNRFPAR